MRIFQLLPEAIDILPFVMGVVPVSSRLINLYAYQLIPPPGFPITYHEIIREAPSYGDGALSDTRWPVHRVRPLLINAMEVDGGGFVTKLVVGMNNNPIALVHVDCWARPLPR